LHLPFRETVGFILIPEGNYSSSPKPKVPLPSSILIRIRSPFDVGDRVDIGDNQLTVERISLLFTIFRKVKDHKTTQVPNIVLNTNWIENVTRSKAMREQVFLYVNFDTTLEDIQLLKNELQSFVLDKENTRDFQADIDVEITGIAEMNKMELKVEIRHKSNWSNETIRAARRSKFMCALVLAIRKIPLYGPGAGDAALGDLAKPSYSVTISEEQASFNRDEFSSNKEKMRLVPTKKPAPPPKEPEISCGNSSGTDYLSKGYNYGYNNTNNTRPSTAAASETTAVETLNTRAPAVDSARDDSPTPSDRRRSNELEEVRGLLRKDSQTGRRKAAPVRPAVPHVPIIAEPTRPPPSGYSPTSTRKGDYHDYTHAPLAPGGRDSPVQRNVSGSPYQSNNPYSAGTPTNATGSPPYQSMGTTMTPPPLQVQTRRPVQGAGQAWNAGNTFAQPQQKPS
jgi:hypothetical protein